MKFKQMCSSSASGQSHSLSFIYLPVGNIDRIDIDADLWERSIIVTSERRNRSTDSEEQFIKPISTVFGSNSQCRHRETCRLITRTMKSMSTNTPTTLLDFTFCLFVFIFSIQTILQSIANSSQRRIFFPFATSIERFICPELDWLGLSDDDNRREIEDEHNHRIHCRDHHWCCRERFHFWQRIEWRGKQGLASPRPPGVWDETSPSMRSTRLRGSKWGERTIVVRYPRVRNMTSRCID